MPKELIINDETTKREAYFMTVFLFVLGVVLVGLGYLWGLFLVFISFFLCCYLFALMRKEIPKRDITMSLRKYVLLGVIASFGIASILILSKLLTTDYPTHSDVFFMGVEAGVLATLLLVCLSLIGCFLYRLTVLSSKK